LDCFVCSHYIDKLSTGKETIEELGFPHRLP
jgi:hypothetical protein